MPVAYFHLRDGVDHTLDPDGIELPDIAAARSLAIKSALDIMSHDIQDRKLDLNLRIDIEDEAGSILDVINFRDLIEVVGLAD